MRLEFKLKQRKSCLLRSELSLIYVKGDGLCLFRYVLVFCFVDIWMDGYGDGCVVIVKYALPSLM
jgi:hypothetical protein